MRGRLILLVALLVGAGAVPQRIARADIAPPKTPPGTTLLPGVEGTYVRMVSETVTLAISADPRDATAASARTDAVFTMRNLGSAEERMRARFPLSFFDGSSDGWFEFPEIPSITVKVDGRSVPTTRELQPPMEDADAYRERDEIPWAVFDVAFPPAQDVLVEVSYTVRGYGYYPQTSFEYVLETGAGWNDTIGSADVIVRLPYVASPQNVFVDESALADLSTPGGVLNGDEIRWHFEDLEPTRNDNILVELVAPGLWQSILKEQDAVTRNPRDGEAWGRLAKGYKEAARLPKGWLRDDPAGLELVALSRDAYQRCLSILPKDPLWHYGYAELLWAVYYWEVRGSGQGDTQGVLPAALSELHTTLELDPNNSLAKDLLLEISSAVDGAVEQDGDDYVFLALTATPHPPTPYLNPPTATLYASTTALPPAYTPTPLPSAEPTARNPLCAGVAVSLFLPAAAFVLSRRRILS